MCENVRINILISVGEMSTKIVDQFLIFGSFNRIVLSIFVNLDMKCLKNVRMTYRFIITNKTCYLELEFHFNYSMSNGFKYSSDS